MSEVRPILSTPPDLGTAGSANVRCHFSTDLDDKGIAAADKCVALLIAATAVGAFAVQQHLKDPSVLTSTILEATTTTRLWRFRWHNCDPRFFQLFRAMLGRLRRDDWLCRSVLVVNGEANIPSPSVMMPWPADGDDDLFYPSVQSEVGRVLNANSNSTSKSRRFLVRLTKSVEASEVTNLRLGAETWFKLLRAGAYAMPIGHPATTESISGAVTQFDDMTVEISVNRFMASELAWSTLANIVVGCNAFTDTVANMEVD